ncbi:MAG: glycoside hydrolase family 28 protein [Sedimentisphaerales bacterium]
MKEKERIFGVVDFGATGNGKANDAHAIQAAIDACSQSGGGRVYFAPGDYLSGTIDLKSDVCLYLEAGATIWGSMNMADYKPVPYCHTTINGTLFMGESIKNVTIEGRGCIDGNGKVFWESEKCNITALKPKLYRPHALLFLSNSENILLRDITLKNSPCYILWLLGCENANIRELTIQNPLDDPNTDGIGIDCSSNVHISDCHIVAGDDCIAIRSDIKCLGRSCDTKNITVTNCTLCSSTCAVRVGYGGDGPPIKNCVFTNLVIYDTRTGIDIVTVLPDPKISSTITEGARIERLVFSNIVMNNVKRPIYIWQGNESGGNFKGMIEDVLINNVVAKSQESCFIGGILGHPIRRLSLNNIKVIIQGDANSSDFEVPCVWDGDKIPWGIYCRYIQGLILNNVQVEWDDASGYWQGALKCENVEELEINAFKGRQFKEGANMAAITLTNCRRSFVHECNASLKTSVFLAVEGRDTEAVKLLANNLAHADKPFEISADVEEKAFCQTANILPD